MHEHHRPDGRFPDPYHRVMPYIESAHMAHRDIPHMHPEQLNMVVDRILHESGVLHHMPHGHTADTMRDLIRVLLLTTGGDMEAAEAMRPIVPLAFGPWFWPWGFGGPFFPHHRHHHQRHRHPGHRPGGGHHHGRR